MLNFQELDHRSLRELVYEELKGQIVTGTITPGTRMLEGALANEIGVSRTPVREAIRQLEKEGLVTIKPRHGAYASQVSIRGMMDALEVRQELEGLAAFLAASRAQQKQINELKDAVFKYNDAMACGNMKKMIEYDTRFHHILVEACDNDILAQMLAQLQEQILRFRYIYYDHFKKSENMLQGHHNILQAIELGDAKAAKEAVCQHIDEVLEVFNTTDLKYS